MSAIVPAGRRRGNCEDERARLSLGIDRIAISSTQSSAIPIRCASRTRWTCTGAPPRSGSSPAISHAAIPLAALIAQIGIDNKAGQHEQVSRLRTMPSDARGRDGQLASVADGKRCRMGSGSRHRRGPGQDQLPARVSGSHHRRPAQPVRRGAESRQGKGAADHRPRPPATACRVGRAQSLSPRHILSSDQGPAPAAAMNRNTKQ